MTEIIKKLLIAVGRPVYRLIKVLRQIKLPKIQRPKLNVEVHVVYQAPRFSWPSLKDILKTIYPLLSRLPVRPKALEPKVTVIRRRYHLNPVKLSVWGSISLLVFIGSIGIYWYLFKDLPSPNSLATQPVSLTTHIRDRHGTELFKIYRNTNRTLIKLDNIPQVMRQATIAIEDKEFYKHSGFSLSGMSRAAWRTWKDNRIEGGSTITQQLVKTSLLSPERTFKRKIRELILAIAVEIKYSKNDILEMYLNRIGYGGTTYGVEEAAQIYFGKSAKDLSLPEAALLAGLPASPTTYSPYGAHPELAKQRQAEVLRRMAEDGYISWDQAASASGAEVQLRPPQANIKAPHFVMFVKELLAQKYGTDVVEQGGLDVITTLDLPLQQEVEKIVKEETAKVAWLRIGNGAALVTRPKTGEILAMVGSRDYFDASKDGNVNVTLALRQPGSSIKPINYVLALTRGFTPASIIDDAPVVYKISGQPDYVPLNYDRRFHGRVTLRTALASSYNVPAVKLLSANGVDKMIQLGRKMGITTWTDPSRFGLSLTLGGGEVTMLDLATAYGVFANGGQRVDLQPILQVRNAQNQVVAEYQCGEQSSTKSRTVKEVIPCQNERVLDSKVTYLISDVLSDNAARTPAFGPRSDLFIPGSQVAVKTGTTNNLKDNWTIGYTPDWLAAVWVGNNDGSPMSYVASGVTGASPIWRRVFNRLLVIKPTSGFTPPSDLLRANICLITGELSCEGCPSRTEWFVPGTQPTRSCNPEFIKQYLEEKARREQEEKDKEKDHAQP